LLFAAALVDYSLGGDVVGLSGYAFFNDSFYQVLFVALATTLPTGVASAAETTMVLLQPEAVQWGDPVLPGSPLPAFERGAKVAVLQGMPGKPGPVVARLKFPANFQVAPHWHSTTVMEFADLTYGSGDASGGPQRRRGEFSRAQLTNCEAHL
jgi:hypothetical protein